MLGFTIIGIWTTTTKQRTIKQPTIHMSNFSCFLCSSLHSNRISIMLRKILCVCVCVGICSVCFSRCVTSFCISHSLPLVTILLLFPSCFGNIPPQQNRNCMDIVNAESETKPLRYLHYRLLWNASALCTIQTVSCWMSIKHYFSIWSARNNSVVKKSVENCLKSNKFIIEIETKQSKNRLNARKSLLTIVDVHIFEVIFT